ncbi:MAG: hypothetical protein M0C28_30255 [Candidatus Moduliflexus flocculans]|nr:hypothetical protein [Candidatus Moduliflexus flocculans]
MARGAALMTGTKLEIAFAQGLSDYVPNLVLGELLQEVHGRSRRTGLRRGRPGDSGKIPSHSYGSGESRDPRTAADDPGARRPGSDRRLSLDPVVGPLFRGDICLPGSTDVGDVSQVVPTGQIIYAAAALGTQAHSWQNTAQAGSAIGRKGMLAAGRALGLAAARAFQDPEIVLRAREEHAAKVGNSYSSPIPETIGPEDVLRSVNHEPV